MAKFDSNNCWEKHYFPFFLSDHIRTEYGEIVNVSEISNGKYEIDHAWN